MQHAHRLTRLSALALGITGALAFGHVQASGFQLKENSVKSMGSAFAGSGVKTGDTSVVVNNPATMTQFEGTTVQADVTVIDLNYEFQGAGTDALGQPLTGNNGGNAGGITPVPAMSIVHKLDNGLALGAMVSAPFGLKTEYEAGWVGRYFAQTSDVRVVDLTFSAAMDIIPDHLSVGIGAIYSSADVTLSKAVDFGTLLFSNPATRPLPFARPQARDGFVEIQGDDTGFGWLAGVNLRPNDRLALGLSYRSEIDYSLSGEADWTVPQDVAAVFGASPMTSPLFRDGGVTAALTTPSVTSLAATYDVSDRFMVMATWAETGWSSLREVRVNFDNPDPDAVEPFEWQDTVFASVGAEFKLSEALTLRGGIAHDETPTSIEHRTPRLPDDDRVWYSLGATWQVSPALDVNLAYTRIEPKDPKVDIAASGSRLTGPFEGNANLFGVSAQYRF
ncbi:OmpP1/FadL family transporter [Lysobacter sp. A3-1-A15]|uniref:OmpP1/FadL family transporter n=1 Tax=Novilysobacter viscosus TaxID=3098602 RepID=UPI002EDB2AA5